MTKLIHIATAFISIGLFILRGIWVQTNPERMKQKWVKIVPHINDTFLLASAILLAIGYQQYPFVHGWITAKVIALVAYIVLGMFALKRAKTQQQKMIFFILSILTFGYIVMVAVTKSVTGVF